MGDVIYTPFMSYLSIAANAHEKMIQYINNNLCCSNKNDEFQHTADGQATIVVAFCVISLECYIHNYASRKLGETFSKRHIDSMNLHTKWLIVPKLATGKSIPADHKGIEHLQKLIKARNAVVHLKAVNLKPEAWEQQKRKITEVNHLILEAALNAFQCVGELGEALFELDPNEPGAKLLAEFLSTPKYSMVKKLSPQERPTKE